MDSSANSVSLAASGADTIIGLAKAIMQQGIGFFVCGLSATGWVCRKP